MDEKELQKIKDRILYLILCNEQGSYSDVRVNDRCGGLPFEKGFVTFNPESRSITYEDANGKTYEMGLKLVE